MDYQIYKIGQRWCGYGVPAACDYPKCSNKIDRGFSYACGEEPGSELGCDRYFCDGHKIVQGFDEDNKPCKHKNDCDCRYVAVCARCSEGKDPFPYKPELRRWLEHVLTDKSWAAWRKSSKKMAEDYRQQLKALQKKSR